MAIVIFRTLVEFYDRPLGLATLPLMIWRFATIGIGSIITGKPSSTTYCSGGWGMILGIVHVPARFSSQHCSVRRVLS